MCSSRFVLVLLHISDCWDSQNTTWPPESLLIRYVSPLRALNCEAFPDEACNVAGNGSGRFVLYFYVLGALSLLVYMVGVCANSYAGQQILASMYSVVFQHQYMPQLTIFSKSASPFWRNRPSNPRNISSKAADSNMVVGASYSHTDILKFDSLWAVSCAYSGFLLTVLEILDAFEFETPHTSISVQGQHTQHFNSTSEIQLRSFFASKTTHLPSIHVTDQQ